MTEPRLARHDAPARRRVSSPRVVITLTTLAAGVAMGFGRFTYGVLLPAMERDLLGSYAVAGLIGTANAAMYLLGTAIVIVASTRVETVRLLRLGLAGSTIGLVLLTVAPGPVMVLSGMALTGVAGAFIWVPAPGVAGSVVPAHRRGVAMGTVGLGIGIGIAFASQLAGAVRHFIGDDAWRQVWAVEAAIGVVALILALRWLHPPRLEQAPAGVRLSALRAVRGWRGVTAAYTAYGLAYALYMVYVVAALEQDAGFSSPHAATVYAVMGVAIIAGGVLLGRISDRLGRRPVLLGGFLTMTACSLLVVVGAEP